jgi:hypothetical protein
MLCGLAVRTSITASTKPCACERLIALPAPRRRPTRLRTVPPGARGNVPGATGRHFPSVQQSQSAARQRPLSGPGHTSSPCRSSMGAASTCRPDRIDSRRVGCRCPSASATPPAPPSCGCCRCSPLRCIPSAPAFRPSESASLRSIRVSGRTDSSPSAKRPLASRAVSSSHRCGRLKGRCRALAGSWVFSSRLGSLRPAIDPRPAMARPSARPAGKASAIQ